MKKTANPLVKNNNFTFLIRTYAKLISNSSKNDIPVNMAAMNTSITSKVSPFGDWRNAY